MKFHVNRVATSKGSAIFLLPTLVLEKSSWQFMITLVLWRRNYTLQFVKGSRKPFYETYKRRAT